MPKYTTIHAQNRDVERLREVSKDMFGEEMPPRVVVNRLIMNYYE